MTLPPSYSDGAGSSTLIGLIAAALSGALVGFAAGLLVAGWL